MKRPDILDIYAFTALYDLRFDLQQIRPKRMSAVNKSPDHKLVGNIQEQSDEQRKGNLERHK